jgi:hypothetical protein
MLTTKRKELKRGEKMDGAILCPDSYSTPSDLVQPRFSFSQERGARGGEYSASWPAVDIDASEYVRKNAQPTPSSIWKSSGDSEK